jgi:tagatose 1,6-diphosphate aldolase
MALGPGDIVSQCMKEGDLRLEFLEFVTHPVHKAPAYYFRMVHALTGEKLGGINLRVGSTPHLELYAGHVGYSVEPAHQGHRYAARSLRLLIPIAQQLGFEALWITCDPENAGSQRSSQAPSLWKLWTCPSTALFIRAVTSKSADIALRFIERRQTC